jgi:VWFA-related protein
LATWQVPSPQAPSPQPVFRGGVDVVQLDVLVLDTKRQPVRGLTAADFTVRERGKPQPVVAFAEVNVPDPVAPAAPWLREVGPDVTSNDLQTRRLIVLVLDDGFTGIDEGEPRLVRQVARQVIDHLGPNDLAAVVFTFMGRFQNFTADRAQLLAAIDSFGPRNWGRAGTPLGCTLKLGGCAANALARIGEVLRTAPPGRKAIMYVGPQFTQTLSMDNPNGPMALGVMRDMFQSLQQANATVYSFDPRGVGVRRPAADPDQIEVALAESTGGRAIMNTNDPAAHVTEIFRENSSYYLLGYQRTDTANDGRFREIEVKVNRPDVDVRTRSGYFASKPSPKVPAASPLEVAIARGMPSGDLTMRVATAAFGVPGRREAELAVVVAVQEPIVHTGATARGSAASVRRVNVVATAFDTSWRSRGAHRQVIELKLNPTERPDAEYEVISRLHLAPGRYEVRFGAESSGVAGSVFATVDIPNFAKDDLSLSGLLLERTPARPIAPRNALADFAPIVPTTVRDFQRADSVTTFLRIYQGGTRTPSAVTLVTRVLDESNQAVVIERVELGGTRFERNRTADYRWSLPLDRLTPGGYLLTIEATMGTKALRRDVRFTVRSGLPVN